MEFSSIFYKRNLKSYNLLFSSILTFQICKNKSWIRQLVPSLRPIDHPFNSTICYLKYQHYTWIYMPITSQVGQKGSELAWIWWNMHSKPSWSAYKIHWLLDMSSSQRISLQHHPMPTVHKVKLVAIQGLTSKMNMGDRTQVLGQVSFTKKW